MKRILILLLVFLLSCTATQESNPSKRPMKTTSKSKTTKKAQEKALVKPEKKEEKATVDTEGNEGKEREEIEKIMDPKNEYTLIEKLWNAFKVNRAEDLLKGLDKGKVYRTKESILYVLKTEELDDSILQELAKIYALQNGKISIYSNVHVKELLVERGLSEEKIVQKSRSDGMTVIRLDIEVSK